MSESVAIADFKAALSRLLGGVSVITTQTPAGPHGMTATSVISVSLNPPLVLVAVSQKAKMYELLNENSHYGVCFLSETQETLSNHFAGRPGADVSWQQPENFKNPMLKGALSWLDCEIVQWVDAGDHRLFIGRVEQVEVFEGKPLGYFRGKYAVLQGP
jgi:flavin reductase (DIM6/NTAB) family NADH-FMN oxidoreductase RutF